MIVSAIAISMVGIFAISLRWCGLRDEPGRVRAAVESALTVLRDARATDRDKELIARATALNMVGVAVRVVLRIGVACLPAAGLLTLVHFVGIADYREILESLASWPVLVVGSLAATAALIK